MHKKTKNNQKGFTLIETLVSVLILAICIDAILSLVTSGYFSVKYARNQIAASTLAQEALEYVRDVRDSQYQQGKTWNTWSDMFTANNAGVVTHNKARGCFSANGCTIDPYASSQGVLECSSTACRAISYYPNALQYGSDSAIGMYGQNTSQYVHVNLTGQYLTNFTRKIQFQPTGTSQLVVTVTITWLNGSTPQKITQSILLADWTL